MTTHELAEAILEKLHPAHVCDDEGESLYAHADWYLCPLWDNDGEILPACIDLLAKFITENLNKENQ